MMKKPVLWKVYTLVRTYRKKSISFIALILILSGSCDQEAKQILEKGLLTGKITVGPLCPVETIPPNPNCQPTEETYKAWPIAVWTTDKKTRLGQIQPNLDGTYSFELPEGSYLVDLEKQNIFGSTLPATVQIDPNETSTLDIDIDTGIR